MEQKYEARMIAALEKIADRLDRFVEIIEDEELYVKGDMGVTNQN